jgi:radical SAM protein with 4Fe4S-binding SPASM domain
MLTTTVGEALIDAGVDMVYLSFDGVTKETYERIRVRSDFERVLTHILDFIELKFRKGADGLTIHVGMTGEIINQHELDVFVREFSKLPVDSVYSPLLFNWIGEVGWAGENLGDLQTPDRAQWPVCNTSYDIIGIQANGNFIPCIYDFNGKYVSGNVRFQTMQELWNNDRTQRFRRAVQTRDYGLIEEKGPMCSQCTILWNPRYNVDPSLAGNLRTVGAYVLNGVKDFATTPIRRARLRKKYQYFQQHRKQWRDNLAQQAAPEQGKLIDVVRKTGFLQIRA